MKNRIKEYRKIYNISQVDLAKTLHVSNATISSWEVNRTEPTMHQVLSLTKIFGCSIEDLFIDGSEPDYYGESGEIKLLIESFQKADDETKAIVRRLLAYNDKLKLLNKKEGES